MATMALAEMDVEVTLVHDEESEKGLPRPEEEADEVEGDDADDQPPTDENSDSLEEDVEAEDVEEIDI